jgi:hypothetical protein
MWCHEARRFLRHGLRQLQRRQGQGLSRLALPFRGRAHVAGREVPGLKDEEEEEIQAPQRPKMSEATLFL